MYVDDIVLFFEANDFNCQSVQRVLHQYTNLTGTWIDCQDSKKQVVQGTINKIEGKLKECKARLLSQADTGKTMCSNLSVLFSTLSGVVVAVNNLPPLFKSSHSWVNIDYIPMNGISIICVSRHYRRGALKSRRVFLSIIYRNEVLANMAYGLRDSEDLLVASFAILRRGL
ncbi:uncharacterized protein G2W53_016418 [Senna tora]|uniref:Uncharacterized protein n=1 Tax=Senna tora TaxID=362788 RepID=A0A834TVZ8_9FABA|nr:uncharacterized protein G2W53_016418 [Senna tora]